MIARIIPLKRLPRRLSFFDYLIPNKLILETRIGQLAQVSFKSSILHGIICDIRENTPEDKKRPLKALDGIVMPQPIVSQKYLSYIIEISELYGISAATLLKWGMMPIQSRKLQNTTLVELPESCPKRLCTKNALIYKNELEHAEQLLAHIQGKSMILVPEINEAETVYRLLPEIMQKTTILWHSKLTTKQQFERWFEIRNGVPEIIIATRGALLLPFFRLDTIIIDYENDENHKQAGQAPRFHVKDLADCLATTHQCPVVYMSHIPSIDTYYAIQKKMIPYHGAILDAESLLFEKKTNPALIFEKTEETGSKHFVAVTATLQQKLIDVADREEDIFVLVNRKDDSEPVRTDNEKPKFMITTQAVEKEILLLLEHTNHSVVRIEKNSRLEKRAKKPRVIVGTEAAFPYIDWNKTGLILYLDVDRQLGMSLMGASEHIWNQIWKMLYHKRKDAECVIQTKIPEHMVLRSLGEPDRFYRTELSHRQRHGYPPYIYLVRYYVTGSDHETTHLEAMRIRADVKNMLTQVSYDCILTNLFELGMPGQSTERTTGFAVKLFACDREIIKKINTLIPDGWKIDPRPLSFTGL